MDNFKHGLDPKDIEIVKRLEALRSDNNTGTSVTDQDIRDRLAILRGQTGNSSTCSSSSNILFKKDVRSDQQKSDDLIKQMAEECKIDQANRDRDDQIATRLKQIKEKGKTDQVQHLEYQEDEVLQVIRQAIMSPSDDEDSNIDTENDSLSEEVDSDKDTDDEL